MVDELTVGLAILSVLLGGVGILLYFIGRHKGKGDIEKIISETAKITAEMLNQHRKIKDDDSNIQYSDGKIETITSVRKTITEKYDIRGIVKKVIICEKINFTENVVVVKNPDKLEADTEPSRTANTSNQENKDNKKKDESSKN